MVNRPRMGRTGPVHVKRRRLEIRMRGALLDEAPPGSLAAVHRRRAVVGDGRTDHQAAEHATPSQDTVMPSTTIRIVVACPASAKSSYAILGADIPGADRI